MILNESPYPIEEPLGENVGRLRTVVIPLEVIRHEDITIRNLQRDGNGHNQLSENETPKNISHPITQPPLLLITHPQSTVVREHQGSRRPTTANLHRIIARPVVDDRT